MNTLTRRLAVGASLLALAGTAAAHTGHGTHGFLEGLEHPFGLDHLLAMVAVGAWSAAALTGLRRWLGPLTFLGAMAVGAAAGVAGVSLPSVEAGIATSVVLMGAMLIFARQLSPALGLVLVAASASLHGLAHGAEMPAGAGFASYATGFLLTTALLHAGGLALGLRIDRARDWAWRIAGSALGAAGLVMLVRL
ncbi:MAG: HupE/UreJ family protein [Burkholderiaceae bacterium]|nr:HupE/UreJ family protein [Burkholderiaceae bacterium]